MKYKAIIFDLDGTLVDTLGDITDSVNHALEKYSLPSHPLESIRQKIGNGSRMLISRSLPTDRQDLIDEILSLQSGYYGEHLFDHSRPYHGIDRMLTVLGENNYKMAVLSNKSDVYTRQLVEKLFPPGTFDLVLGHQQKFPLKPDPQSALFIAEQLEIQPSQIAFVGDTAMDIQTARHAGMFAIGVTWGFRDRGELVRNHSNAIIEQPAQLPTLLKLLKNPPDF